MLLAYRFHRPLRVLAVPALLAVAGCAHEALDNQLASSREAVDQARIVGAPEKAPADFDVAVNKLDRATAASQTRDKDEAMRLAQQAEIDANYAQARTNAMQAKLAASEMAKSNEILRAELSRTTNQNQQR